MEQLREACFGVLRGARNSAWQLLLAGRGKAWSDITFYPEARRVAGPGYGLPGFLDRSVPWVASLEALYALPASRPASISPEAGLLLQSLVRSISPRVVVETGTFLTVSTQWIAAALLEDEPGAVVHSFDTFEVLETRFPGLLKRAGASGHLEFAESAVRRAGLEGVVRLHKGKSADQIERLRDSGELGAVQLAFIDADHSVRGVVRDFRAVEPSLETGGYVVLHDVYPDRCGHEGPRALMDELLAGGRYQGCGVFTVPQNFGMAVLQRVG